jgi:amino acid permease
MSRSEPKNPFYILLLLASLAFTVTALAYAVVPTLEEKAIDAGQTPSLSPFRHALRADGWKWLAAELAAMILFSALSMGLDRLRSLQKARAANTMPPSDPARISPENREQ